MGIVRSIQKGEQPASKFSKDAQDTAKKMKKSSVKKYAKTKHDDLPTKKIKEGAYKSATKNELAQYIINLNNMLAVAKSKKMTNHIDYRSRMKEYLSNLVKQEIISLGEETKRDYKAEYKKFQSSTKSKKYRAELNKYNRDKGTYGNGDGKDASHKGGKIVGFESESKNRGRAEKSRLKKESVNEGKVDRVVGHTRYKYVGDGRKGQAIVSGPMKDREKEAIIKRAKKAGYNAKPNMGGGVTIHVESLEVNEIGQFPIHNYIQGIIPTGYLDTNTPQKKKQSVKLVSDLKKTLNTFWKQHDIPYRIK